MNSFVIILSCLSAVALANPGEILEYFHNGQRTCRTNCRRANPLAECPPSNCPPAVRDPNCAEPNCNLEGNRYVHHPHQDPNFYWHCQMADGSGNNWMAVLMPCACGTLFWSPANRCVHPHEWSPETFCISSQPPNPQLRDCPPPDCPSCNGQGPEAPGPPETTTPGGPTPPTTSNGNGGGTTTTGNGGGNGPPTTTEGNGNGPPNGCPCICIPCILWPCMPCNGNGVNTCPCPQQPQQPQQPQLPPQQPWHPPNQINPWDRPQQNPWEVPNQQNPWERPQPNPWDQPQQNPWDQPQQNPWDQPQQNPWNRPAPWELPQNW